MKARKRNRRSANEFRRQALKLLGVNGFGLKNRDLIVELCKHFDIQPKSSKEHNCKRLLNLMAGKAPSDGAIPERSKPRPKKVAPSKIAGDRFKDFYDSWEWKRVRYDFLKGKARRCGCCGADATTAKIVVDHVKPIRLYWELRLDPANLQLLCDDCNMGKGSRDETDWRTQGLSADKFEFDDFLAVKTDAMN